MEVKMTENREQFNAPSKYKKQIKVAIITVLLVEAIALLTILYLFFR